MLNKEPAARKRYKRFKRHNRYDSLTNSDQGQ